MGALIGITLGMIAGAVIVFLVKAPFRIGGYAVREVRARDARNRETLGLPPRDTRPQPERLRDTAARRRQMAQDLRERQARDAS